jgi:hypothetical protein
MRPGLGLPTGGTRPIHLGVEREAPRTPRFPLDEATTAQKRALHAPAA